MNADLAAFGLPGIMIAGLVTFILMQRKDIRRWQTLWRRERDQRLAELKEAARSSELFVRALEQLQRRSPPTR